MAKKPARHPDDEIHLKLRLSERLRRRLENAASKNSRSMNSEILDRLERSFEPLSDDQRQLIKEAAETAARATAGMYVVYDPSRPTDVPRDNLPKDTEK
jgi:hypothetical protein